jgi:glycosyltransferase involved in cell wall biosynthesis
MIKNLLSVIIPSRDPRYLQKTIDDILVKAEGKIEIIVVLDGLWHNPMPKDDPRVIIIHHGTPFSNKGMRESINKGMALARGEFVAKTDEHCMFSKGFDKVLIDACEEHDVLIPRRKRLDPDKWENVEDGRADIDYMSIETPFERANDKTCGLHGRIWKRPGREDIVIDLTPTMQGSFYFMRKSHWDSVIGFMDEEKYGPFQQEAQEISFKTYFMGGNVKVVKNCFYSHWHKGNKGRNYSFSNAQYVQHGIDSEKGRKYCRDYWLTTQDFKEKYGTDLEWFVNKFPEMPGWEKGWETRIAEARKL